jgi:hypothetical protein
MTLAIELKIQKGIRNAEDEIVIAIETALNNSEGYCGLEESQFRNLLNVATSTDSSEVVKNFLYYQMGRDKKWGRGDNSLAKTIIRDIEKLLKSRAVEIANNAKIVEDIVGKTNAIHIELIRRYLGYGSRYLLYKNKGENATQ